MDEYVPPEQARKEGPSGYGLGQELLSLSVVTRRDRAIIVPDRAA